METAVIIVSIAASVSGGTWVLTSRLSSIEQRLVRVETVVDKELTLNGGGSLKDRVDRIDKSLTALQHDRALPD